MHLVGLTSSVLDTKHLYFDGADNDIFELCESWNLFEKLINKQP